MNNINKKRKQKTKDEEIKESLTELEKVLGNFKLNIDQKDKKIKEYINLSELARTEYKKVVQENNLLKRQLLGLKSNQSKPKKAIKRKYIVEDSDSETDSAAESDTESSEEEQQDEKIAEVEQYPKVKKLKKTTEKTNSNKKQKLFDYINKKE